MQVMTFEGSAEASVAWEAGVVASFCGTRIWIEISLEFQKSKCMCIVIVSPLVCCIFCDG